MREFEVFIDNVAYSVKVNEVGGNGGPSGLPEAPKVSELSMPETPKPAAVQPPKQPAAAPVQKPASPQLVKTAPVSQPTPAAAPVSGEGEAVTSPLPGTIQNIFVTTGQQVKKGDVLLTIEAMKMENEIMASGNGVVSSVNVVTGASVDTGTVLCVIR